MKKKLIILAAFIIHGMSAFAQTQDPTAAAGSNAISQLMTDPFTYLLVFTFAVLLATIMVMARVIRLLIWQIAGVPKAVEKPIVEETARAMKETWWTKMNKKLNDAVPVEKEADVLLDHDYDGIKELDNNLPPWWKYGFYLTIVFAFVYMIHYHVVGSGNVQLDEYNAEITEAEIQKAERLKMAASAVDESTATMMLADADLSAGKKIFMDKCLVCHGAGGEGTVGPNLTDDYWIHGGDIKDVFKIVKYGFPSKGMLAWQGQLSPVQIQQVSSFVKSLKGTNPPNPKEPQGELYKEAVADAESDQAAPVDSAATDSTTANL